MLWKNRAGKTLAGFSPAPHPLHPAPARRLRATKGILPSCAFPLYCLLRSNHANSVDIESEEADISLQKGQHRGSGDLCLSGRKRSPQWVLVAMHPNL